MCQFSQKVCVQFVCVFVFVCGMQLELGDQLKLHSYDWSQDYF